jgi:DMSO/TMAO reductase YedYZ molybdopterin-dependent catalytic subunit
VNGTSKPQDAYYQELSAGNFKDWTMPVEGMVARPAEYSLESLKSLPSRTQVTQHSCEEGWSAIAEWTGVSLSHVLEAAGILPEARYVFFFTVDDWWDSLDMLDALHPQTILAYGMNGGDLPMAYGAPVRLRVERQLGYKHLKYVSSILVTDRLDQVKDGTGSVSVGLGYSWYAGI